MVECSTLDQVVPGLSHIACLFVNLFVYSFVLIMGVTHRYNPFLVYCRELASGTVSLTGDRAQGDDSKHDSHYNDMYH